VRGLTALILAAQKGHAAVCEVLVQLSADVHANIEGDAEYVHPESGSIALHFAVQNVVNKGDEPRKLETGADPATTNEHGRDARYWAKREELPLTAALLEQALAAKAAAPEPEPEPESVPEPAAAEVEPVAEPEPEPQPAPEQPTPAPPACAGGGALSKPDGPELSICRGCKSEDGHALPGGPRFCSRACQRLSWDGGHREVCPRYTP